MQHVQRLEATRCSKDIQNTGLGHLEMVDTSLAVLRKALLTGIWLISKLLSMKQFRAE